jgi:hypothetical protein
VKSSPGASNRRSAIGWRRSAQWNSYQPDKRLVGWRSGDALSPLEIDQKFVSQHKRIGGCGNLAAPAGIDLPASIIIEIFGDGIASASPGAN